MADMLLPVWVYNLPASFAFQPDGRLREKIAALPKGIVRVLAGPTECHVCVDVQRPYNRPISAMFIDGAAND
jgi:hypothetical protein